MTVSAVFTFDPSRTQIIEAAMKRIGVLTPGQSATSDQLVEGTFWLNLLVKALQNDGDRLWTEEWETYTLTASSEVLGSDGLNYECIRPHTSAASNKPVTGADWPTYWTQRGSSGGAWATSTSYTSQGSFLLPARTVGVTKAYYRSTQNNDLPIQLIKFSEYMDKHDKTLKGDPINIALDEDISQPRVYMYPIPDQLDQVINILRIRPLYDYDAPGDTSDFPQRWVEAIIFGLAERLGHVYGLDLNELQLLENRYREAKQKAKRDDTETVTTNFIQSAF